MKLFPVFSIGLYLFISVAGASQVLASQSTTDTASYFHGPCEPGLQPIPSTACEFDAVFDETGNLNLTIQSPNQLGMSGQFGTDFPDSFSASIPAEMLTHEPGVPPLLSFTSMTIDSNRSDLCNRFMRTALSYDHKSNQMEWRYSTFSQCSHDNYTASLKLHFQDNLTIQRIEYEGRKSAMAMCPGGYSHGFRHQFTCRWTNHLKNSE